MITLLQKKIELIRGSTHMILHKYTFRGGKVSMSALFRSAQKWGGADQLKYLSSKLKLALFISELAHQIYIYIYIYITVSITKLVIKLLSIIKKTGKRYFVNF
jgi:hypothetical protein